MSKAFTERTKARIVDEFLAQRSRELGELDFASWYERYRAEQAIGRTPALSTMYSYIRKEGIDLSTADDNQREIEEVLGDDTESAADDLASAGDARAEPTETSDTDSSSLGDSAAGGAEAPATRSGDNPPGEDPDRAADTQGSIAGDTGSADNGDTSASDGADGGGSEVIAEQRIKGLPSPPRQEQSATSAGTGSEQSDNSGGFDLSQYTPYIIVGGCAVLLLLGAVTLAKRSSKPKQQPTYVDPRQEFESLYARHRPH